MVLSFQRVYVYYKEVMYLMCNNDNINNINNILLMYLFFFIIKDIDIIYDVYNHCILRFLFSVYFIVSIWIIIL